MCRKFIYILVSYMIYSEGSPVYDTIVDQSQSGDVNVEVSLKNVEIIAVLSGAREQYTDYDYNYDYTEMTIKPPNKTSTVSPLNETSSNASDSTLQADTTYTTVKPDERTSTLKSSEDTQGSSTTTVVSESSSLNPTVSSVQSNFEMSSNPTPAATVASTDGLKIDANAAASSAAMEESTEPAQKECRKGFHRNKKGECELKLKPSSTNALLKLVELSQKLKLRRAN